MIAVDKTTTFTVVFGVASAVLYTVATEINLPVATYHPVTGVVDFLWKAPRPGSGPAMYWYGWMLTSLFGALLIAFVATLVPEGVLQRVIIFAAFGAFGYLVVSTVALFVYANASVELEFLRSRWTSVIAAALLAAIGVYLAPTRWTARLWPGWIIVVPIGALAVLGYYLIPFFTR